MTVERKKILLRLDPAVHDALARWAGDELRSTNAQIEFLLRRALSDAGRMPRDAAGMARRGRPPKATRTPDATATDDAAGNDTAGRDSAADDTAGRDSAGGDGDAAR